MRVNPAYSVNIAELAAETDPDQPEANFSVKDVLAEMTAARDDAQWFLKQMEQNEKTRLSFWEGKNHGQEDQQAGQRCGHRGTAQPITGCPRHPGSDSHSLQPCAWRRSRAAA